MALKKDIEQAVDHGPPLTLFLVAIVVTGGIMHERSSMQRD